jgi:hypothetical protein
MAKKTKEKVNVMDLPGDAIIPEDVTSEEIEETAVVAETSGDDTEVQMEDVEIDTQGEEAETAPQAGPIDRANRIAWDVANKKKDETVIHAAKSQRPPWLAWDVA